MNCPTCNGPTVMYQGWNDLPGDGSLICADEVNCTPPATLNFISGTYAVPVCIGIVSNVNEQLPDGTMHTFKVVPMLPGDWPAPGAHGDCHISDDGVKRLQYTDLSGKRWYKGRANTWY